MHQQPVVIGGGPAGCAAAIALARAGHRPVLIERNAGPMHKVCGDFLGVDTIGLLAALGVDPLHLGAARIDRVRLVHRRAEAEVRLPFPALSLSRLAIDQALLACAADAGAQVQAGETVRRLARDARGWTVLTDRPIAAPSVFLATGKHDLRAHQRPHAETDAVGLKMYFDMPADSASELVLFDGGYAGLQPTERGTAMCIAVTRTAFRAAGGSWETLLDAIGADCPRFAERMRPARPLLPRPLSVAGVPYGFIHRDQGDGLFRVGDQMAVIPSLTGDGMAIALQTGLAAGRAFHNALDPGSYHRAMRRHLRGQMRLATLLHKAFLAPSLQPAAVRAAGWLPSLTRMLARGTRVRRLQDAPAETGATAPG